MPKDKSIKALILLWIVTLIILSATSISKYKNVMIGNDSARVATPIINLEENILDIKISPNDEEKNYIFKVSNKEGDRTSEASMQYTLEIKNANNLPIEFELYNYKNGIADNTNLLEDNKTKTIPLKLNDEEHEYQLKIKWNKEDRDYQYSRVIDYVQIILNSTQID